MNPEELKALIKEVVVEVINETQPSPSPKKKTARKKATVKKKASTPKQKTTRKKKEVKKDEFDFTVSRNENESNAKPVKWSGENKFDEMIDQMTAEATKEQGFDRINDNVERSPRTRPKYKTIDVTCDSCNKDFSINPIYKTKEKYTCDVCIAKR